MRSSLFHRSKTSPASRSPNVILYLPPGPIFPGAPPERDSADGLVLTTPAENQLLTLLSAASDATVVRVNYRLSDTHPFPTAVHDVLAAYDWVTANLGPPTNGRIRTPTVSDPSVGVCGELVGGGLATMLALTECRPSRGRIVAAAVNNPIPDWLFPVDPDSGSRSDARSDADPSPPLPPLASDASESVATDLEFADLTDVTESSDQLDHDGDNEDASPPRRSSSGTPKRPSKPKETSWSLHADSPDLSASHLYRARGTLFKTAQAVLDPFASPILFLRSPGVELPPPDAPDPTNFSALRHSKRKVPRLYPPTGSGLRLPTFRITAGESCLLRDQAAELASRLRRSIVKQHLGLSGIRRMRQRPFTSSIGHALLLDEASSDLDGDRGGPSEEQLRAAEEVADGRVMTCFTEGVGLWSLSGRSEGDVATHSATSPKRKRDKIHELADWFRHTFTV